MTAKEKAIKYFLNKDFGKSLDYRINKAIDIAIEETKKEVIKNDKI